MEPSHDELLEVALAAARAAVEVHREHLGRTRPEDWATKGAADFVTFVDREAERRAVGIIRTAFPGHAIVAEEGTGTAAGLSSNSGTVAGDEVAPDDAGIQLPAAPATWSWLVDPLDGTTNYLHRYPAYAASVAALRNGEPVAGAVVSGATGEEWTAALGAGASKDGEPIRVSDLDRLDLALIGTGFPFRALELLPAYLRQFDAVLRSTAGVRRAGSAALDLCHLATGWFDGFWELYLAPWDVAAGALIVQEAGGIVTRLDGRADILDGTGSILAGNPVLYARIAELVRGATETDTDATV